MLFTPPILALEAVRKSASVAFARVPGWGTLFITGTATRSGQHEVGAFQTDVRTAPGWLSARRPGISMAGRGKSLGTELSTLLESMVAAAPGWLSARPSNSFAFSASGALGTARLSLTDVRTAPGWLSGRRPVFFQAGRAKSLGTELSALFKSMVRTAPGWLSVRATMNFLSKGPVKLFGQLHDGSFDPMAGAAARVLPARPSHDFSCRGVSMSAPLMDGPRSDHSDSMIMSRAVADTPLHEIERAHVDFSQPTPPGGYHLPVMPEEIVEWMAPTPGAFVIDGTLGGGGHSELFLQAGARVLGVDRDPEALAHARERLARFGENFTTWEGNFSQIREIPGIQKGERADGLLMDLGVSSRQLDSAARGFSFMRDGPLDMRMGPSSPRTAADIVNSWSEAELVRIFFEFGEEPKARRIAGALVQRREEKPFTTTLDLASCIERAVGRQGKTHPVTRVFQAIRMAVNEELESLATALSAASQVLKPGGRLLVITFHSLEDRMVKRFLKHHSTEFLDDPTWPAPRPNPDCQFRLLARKAIHPTAKEISTNPRARSAKLRVAQLLEHAA